MVVDTGVARKIEERWARLGLSRFPLDLVECPDRRLQRATLELAAQAVADGQTELTMLLPRRGFTSGWSRVLHDRTADKIAAVVGQLPHVNATMVPYQLTSSKLRLDKEAQVDQKTRVDKNARVERKLRQDQMVDQGSEASISGSIAIDRGPHLEGAIPIGEVIWRQRARVAGRVKSVRVQPRAGVASLEATLVDGTGGLLLVFQGRRKVPGIKPGAELVAEGMVGERERRLAILNPAYELLAGPEDD